MYPYVVLEAENNSGHPRGLHDYEVQVLNW